ncbi:MAG: c-type cytochrome [Desulfobacterales bacterium]|jgi:mono/diheme cytochrome c family protein|nr:c-type cytochrome [Desulfobacterales bacterium]
MKKVAVLFAAVAVLTFVAIQALNLFDHYFPWGRMWETPAVKPHEEPLLVMPAGSVPLDGGEALYRAAAPADLASPFSPQDAATIESGQTLYASYCAQCHGRFHDGNGTVGQSFSPLPTDLRSPQVQEFEPGRIFKEISYGVPGGRQPPLATTIEAQDRWRIVAYVKSLGLRN